MFLTHVILVSHCAIFERRVVTSVGQCEVEARKRQEQDLSADAFDDDHHLVPAPARLLAALLSLLSISCSGDPANTSIDYLPSFVAASSGMLASLASLPEELLEPILREAVEPGTKRGADILFVNHVFHRIGRPFLYRLVEVVQETR